MARETRSHARVETCEGPSYRSRARPCKSGSPDPDPFVIRRAQTTEGETHIMTMEIAAETRSPARMASEKPRLRRGKCAYPSL